MSKSKTDAKTKPKDPKLASPSLSIKLYTLIVERRKVMEPRVKSTTVAMKPEVRWEEDPSVIPPPKDILAMLKAIPYAPKSETEITAGFTSVTPGKANDGVVNAEFAARYPVSLLTYSPEGELVKKTYIVVDTAKVKIKTDRGIIEVRGSERTARRFGREFRRALRQAIPLQEYRVRLPPLNLNGGSRKIYTQATEISSVLVSGLSKGNLSQIEFKGQAIQAEGEVGLYERKFGGHIARFRGKFPYPSGATFTTSVNTDSGTALIYRGESDRIIEKDINYIVSLLEEAALGS
ncbi:MAG: hypothetical protein HXY34_09140 [Candidatus Thorarchaeota archaeon]|nr:hypothetical protein [Candidatus Thorarchaeota archaeon]